ncbi:hypothetical protein A499_17380 [Niallia nealsonii AAU1]|nr:hypothetical protein A499_17380 [Niallia nealsonii AAU1]
MKIIKDSAIFSLCIFIINFVISLIFNPNSIIKDFKIGVWYAFTVYTSSFVMLFAIVLLFLFIRRYILRLKNL